MPRRHTTIKYCYDGDRVIAEYDVNDNLLRKFVYGPGIDEPICMIDVNGETETKYYYHFDGLGSVVALSDVNNVVVERYSYDVFGEPNTTSSVSNPYMFTGRRYDPEAGLYYYRARYYAYDIGRFLQPDPIGYYDSMNLYAYCLNDPVNSIDPYGKGITKTFWCMICSFQMAGANEGCGSGQCAHVCDGVCCDPAGLLCLWAVVCR